MEHQLTGIVVAIAVVPALLAWLQWGVWPSPVLAVLVYASFTGFVVATAASDLFAHRSTWLLGKADDGRLANWSWVVWWPYHTALRIKLLIKRWVMPEPLYHEILPGWWLGGWPASPELLPPNCPAVLDITCELPRTHCSKYYMCLQVWDTQAPLVSQIQAGVAWSLEQRAAGHSVYVHCAHGHGRSAILLCACLLQMRLTASLEAGMVLLKSIRPLVNLNARQRDVLQRWSASRESELLLCREESDMEKQLQQQLLPSANSQHAQDMLAQQQAAKAAAAQLQQQAATAAAVQRYRDEKTFWQSELGGSRQNSPGATFSGGHINEAASHGNGLSSSYRYSNSGYDHGGAGIGDGGSASSTPGYGSGHNGTGPMVLNVNQKTSSNLSGGGGVTARGNSPLADRNGMTGSGSRIDAESYVGVDAHAHAHQALGLGPGASAPSPLGLPTVFALNGMATGGHVLLPDMLGLQPHVPAKKSS